MTIEAGPSERCAAEACQCDDHYQDDPSRWPCPSCGHKQHATSDCSSERWRECAYCVCVFATDDEWQEHETQIEHPHPGNCVSLPAPAETPLADLDERSEAARQTPEYAREKAALEHAELLAAARERFNMGVLPEFDLLELTHVGLDLLEAVLKPWPQDKLRLFCPNCDHLLVVEAPEAAVAAAAYVAALRKAVE